MSQGTGFTDRDTAVFHLTNVHGWTLADVADGGSLERLSALHASEHDAPGSVWAHDAGDIEPNAFSS